MTEWRGKKIAIRNEKIRVFLLNYREFQAQIDTTDLTDDGFPSLYSIVIWLLESGSMFLSFPDFLSAAINLKILCE